MDACAGESVIFSFHHIEINSGAARSGEVHLTQALGPHSPICRCLGYTAYVQVKSLMGDLLNGKLVKIQRCPAAVMGTKRCMARAKALSFARWEAATE
jgi:hypothetical protein